MQFGCGLVSSKENCGPFRPLFGQIYHKLTLSVGNCICQHLKKLSMRGSTVVSMWEITSKVLFNVSVSGSNSLLVTANERVTVTVMQL